MDCNIEVNMDNCTCSSLSCVRKGKCCECIAYHLKSEALPGCVFPPEVEKTFDRSFARFVETFQSRNGSKS